jgi:hypothetical protein
MALVAAVWAAAAPARGENDAADLAVPAAPGLAAMLVPDWPARLATDAELASRRTVVRRLK